MRVFHPGPVVVRPSFRRSSTSGLAAGPSLSSCRLRGMDLVVWPVRGRVTSRAMPAVAAAEKRCVSFGTLPNPPNSCLRIEAGSDGGATVSGRRSPPSWVRGLGGAGGGRSDMTSCDARSFLRRPAPMDISSAVVFTREARAEIPQRSRANRERWRTRNQRR